MNSLNDPFETNDTLRRISRFLAVGMLGTLTDMLLFAILHTGLGVPTLVPNTLSYCAGIVNNFLLRRHWTFAQLTHQALGMQVSRFAMVSLGALMINNLLVLWLAPSFGSLLAHPGYGVLAAKVCATGVSVSWNSLANNFCTFRGAPQRVRQ